MTKNEMRKKLDWELMYKINEFYRCKEKGNDFSADDYRMQLLGYLEAIKDLNGITDREWYVVMNNICFMGTMYPMEKRLELENAY